MALTLPVEQDKSRRAIAHLPRRSEAKRIFITPGEPISDEQAQDLKGASLGIFADPGSTGAIQPEENTADEEPEP